MTATITLARPSCQASIAISCSRASHLRPPSQPRQSAARPKKNELRTHACSRRSSRYPAVDVMDTAGQVVDGAGFHCGWAGAGLARCAGQSGQYRSQRAEQVPRSDSDRALMTWVMTAWMASS